MMLSAIVVVSGGDESRLGKLLKGGCRPGGTVQVKKKGPEARSPTATWPTTTTNGHNLSTTLSPIPLHCRNSQSTVRA